MNYIKQLIVSFILGCSVANIAIAMEEGKTAPSFTAKMLDGKTIDSNVLKGQVVVLHFWATWCETCRQEMPALDIYYRQHQQEGLHVIAISMDDKKNDLAVQKFMQDFHFPAAYERDSDYKAFGRIWAMPMTFVIDREGVLRTDGSTHPWVMDAGTLEKNVSPLLRLVTVPDIHK